MDTLYREEILEHYRDPQNFGVLEDYDMKSHQHNPFCGDDIELFVKFQNPSPSLSPKQGEGVLSEISFYGTGCAISIASGSILTEFAKGKAKEELLAISDTDMVDMLGVEVSETRKKCALLTLWTLRDCLK